MKRLLVLFAGPRSGSNYLIDILGRIPGSIALSEMFNPRGAYGLNLYPDLETRMQDLYGTPEAISHHLRSAPAEALDTLMHEVPEDAPVIVKIQPNQVHALAICDILRDHAAGALILTRTRLDQYVSLRKARAADTWFKADTTDVRPDVKPESFLSWTSAHEAWIRQMARLCHSAHVPLSHLSYDRDLKSGTPQEIAETLSTHLGAMPITVAPANLLGTSWFTRQDKAEDPFDKVANGADLRARLDRLGVLDMSLAAPDLDETPADGPPDLIQDPGAGADLIRAGDFATLRSALDRIGRDIAPGSFRPETLDIAEHGAPRLTFICGLHRSGTTLLHDHIAARFDVATLHHDTAPRNEGQFLQDVLPQEAPFGGPGHFAFAPQMVPAPVRDRRQASALANRLLDTWTAHADRPDHPQLLEKSPTNLTRIAWLRSVFPGARFVIITRDPRAVALSTRAWRPASLDLLLAHWHAAHLAALAQMDSDCHVLRYEDFCDDPDTHLAQIADVCGLTPRDTPLPDHAAPIRDRTPERLADWPPDTRFAPALKAWELFGYRF